LRTVVYIDGFNLFYNALKRSSYKWLDLNRLCEIVLPHECDIKKINYYTANVKDRTNNPGTLNRQNTYLRAINAHCPNLEIIKGHYTEHAKLSPMVTPGGELDKKDVSGRGRELSSFNKRLFAKMNKWMTDPGPRIHVINTEEKGSDVNLAVHLVNDGWKDVYDCCVVISNDSDMAEGMRIVKEELGKKVILVNTWKQRPTSHLKRYASIVRTAKKSAFAKSQMPNPIPGTKIHKPEDWES